MTSFHELYNRILMASLKNNLSEEIDKIKQESYDPHQLDCLLNPGRYPPVVRIGDCICNENEKNNCMSKCFFNALEKDEKGNITVNKEQCVGCAQCIEDCHANKLIDNKNILPIFQAIHNSKMPVYAMIAPAFVNQYSSDVTPGKLRAAFKKIGFIGMVEVALFADILTLKEALEFDKNILNEKDYQITSCCCPMWIAMLRKFYRDLIPHIPAAVSPMVACGRSIKTLHPNAITVFIGPCVAKKAEAREQDIADSTDFVLTFHEMQDIFEFAGINPADMCEDMRDHSSRAGRIYASTGGVSEAVQRTVKELNPDRKITVNTVQADGIPACKQLLSDLVNGKITENFIEGMGCNGGCVGGPKTLISKEEARENVFNYGKEAKFQTPINNPYVIEILHRLGFETVESLLENSDIFTRNF